MTGVSVSDSPQRSADSDQMAETALEKTDRQITGTCEFHSETGTEGGYWAVQDEAWTHRRGEPCFDKSKADGTCWAYSEHNTVGAHAGYEGLHILRNGDHLTIYAADGTTVEWSGEIALHLFPLFTEDAGGMWIHADQVGIDRDKWAAWFFEEHPCALVRSEPS